MFTAHCQETDAKYQSQAQDSRKEEKHVTDELERFAKLK